MAILPRANKKPAFCIGTTDNSGFFSSNDGESWKTQHYLGGDNDWCFSDPLQPSRLIVFAPRHQSIYLYTRSDSSSVPDGTIPGKTIPEAPRIPDPSLPNGIRAWNVVSTFTNIGYRPLILTLKNQLPSDDGDFVAILSTWSYSNMDAKTGTS